MQDSPFISIITPCFNSVETIEDTLSSVLKQDYHDYEYVIVDGGSTDGTLDVIKRYEPLFEGRLKWISEHDHGIYDAFNKGCKRASGTLLWIVNSDDYIEEGALSKISQCSKEGGQSVIIGGIHFVTMSGKHSSSYIPTEKDIKVAFSKDWMVPHPSMVIPRRIYEQFGYYDEKFRVAADKDLFHRLYANGVQFQILECYLTNMRDGGVSQRLCFKKEASEQWLFFTNKYGVSLKACKGFFKWSCRFVRNMLMRKNGN